MSARPVSAYRNTLILIQRDCIDPHLPNARGPGTATPCVERGLTTSKTVSGDTTEYVLDLAAMLPVVISDTEAVDLYGLDIVAQQQSDRDPTPFNGG